MANSYSQTRRKREDLDAGTGTLTGFKPIDRAVTMGASPGAAQPTAVRQTAEVQNTQPAEVKNTQAAEVQKTQTADAETTGNGGGYQASDAVRQAEAMLNQQLSQKPGDYQSAWQTQLDDIMNRIMNREQFNYDLNGDALYQQYKDKYIQQGRMAMMDTMGQAAAMTGGYGNSYAQSVGQQAYQAQLQNLNDVIPELYQLALDKYNQEEQDLYNQFGMMADRESQDYARYRDSVGDWQAEQERLYQQYMNERDFDYGQYIDARNYQYQQDRDAAADAQWQAEFDEAKRQYDQDYALNAKKSSGGSSGSSGYYSDTSKNSASDASYKYGGLSESQVRNLIAAEGSYDAAADLVYDMVDDGYWSEDFLIGILEELFPEPRDGVGTPSGGGHSKKNTVNMFN